MVSRTSTAPGILNQLRIIGGKWKRRKLGFPDRPHLRPSLGRTRETLFNWLMADVPGARCLDLYAGSGALGFEALSRGAAHVTFVDEDREVTRALERNMTLLGATDAIVIRARARQWLARDESQWDIVFLDPPFGSDELAHVLPALLALQRVHTGSLVYIEFDPRHEPALTGWEPVKSTRAGDTRARLLRPAP
jgi:16S rRNA (guanine966-N2)-methyltransferase